MLHFRKLDDRYLDRYGCGDELYLDSRSKAAMWLTGSLSGATGESYSCFDFDDDLDFGFASMDEDGDAANH
jgi:hypothetical protein